MQSASVDGRTGCRHPFLHSHVVEEKEALKYVVGTGGLALRALAYLEIDHHKTPHFFTYLAHQILRARCLRGLSLGALGTALDVGLS